VQEYLVPRSPGIPVRLHIAGGPSVLGYPAEGTRGVRRIVVRQEQRGKLVAEVNHIPLGRSKTLPKSMVLLRPGEPPPQCRVTGESAVDLRSAPITMGDTSDSSDEWMLFLNVISCEKARTTIQNERLRLPEDIPKALRYMSLYDLYGRHDVLFRFAGPNEAI